MLGGKLSLPITCPACGHKFKQALGQVQAERRISCPACNTVIELNMENLRRGLERAGQEIGKKGRELSKRFKTKL